MIALDVRADFKDASRWLTRVQRQAVPRAGARAMNRVGTTMRKEAVNAIADSAKIKKKNIRARMSIRKANRRHLQVVITAGGGVVPLIEYSARKTRRGVTVNVKRGRKLVKGAFISTMKSGHRGVFRRRGRARLKIDEMYSSTVAQLFVNTKARRRIERVAEARWPIEFDRELRHALRQVA